MWYLVIEPYFVLASVAPGLMKTLCHRPRRLPLYQERRRTWSVLLGMETWQRQGGFTVLYKMEVSPKDRKVGKPGNSGEHVPWNPHGQVCWKRGWTSKFNSWFLFPLSKEHSIAILLVNPHFLEQTQISHRLLQKSHMYYPVNPISHILIIACLIALFW